MKILIIWLIRCYQRIMSFFPISSCRFYPSCSEYMAESIEKKGLTAGIFRGCIRILRCNPFNPGGYDPVNPEGDTNCRG